MSTKCEIAILQHQYTCVCTHTHARIHTPTIWGCVCSFIGKDIQVFLVLQNKCFLFLNLLKPPLSNTLTESDFFFFFYSSFFICIFKVVVFALCAFFYVRLGEWRTKTNLNCQNNVVTNFSREEGQLLCVQMKSSLWANQKTPRSPTTPPRLRHQSFLKTISHRRDLF